MTAAPREIVVVGASAAGLATLEGLRRAGYDGRLTVVGDEVHLPYDRSPLSKQLLSGEWETGKLALRDAEVYAELGVELRLGTPAASLDSAACKLHLADGTALGYQDHGVDIVTDAMAEGVRGDGGRVTGVRLVDGRTVEADVVVIGIGTLPNVEWLEGSGVPVGDGVECDETLHAAHGVWAAGDVASFPDPATGERIRIEHRTNAGEQGMAVARNILAGEGEAKPFSSVPYVWSDQYDLKIQIYGRSRGADRIHVVDGSLADRKFTALCARDGHVTAAIGINMVRPLRGLRPVVADRTEWDTAVAAQTPAA